MNIKTHSFPKISSIKGDYCPPADKSITHKALVISAMAAGRSMINNILMCADSLVTMNILEAVGVKLMIKEELPGVTYKGAVYRADLISGGYSSFDADKCTLWCGNSETAASLFAGILAPNVTSLVLDGDISLRSRSMGRMITPLRCMGADIESVNNDNRLPIRIKKANMYSNEIIGSSASAQVKSSVLLAGLQLEGETVYHGKYYTRDHTERMLPFFGVNIRRDDKRVYVRGRVNVTPEEFDVPGDISSAAIMIAAAHMYEGAYINIHNVGLNPTRTAFLDILKIWGADITISVKSQAVEPFGDVYVRYSLLKGGLIDGDLSLAAIDELPQLAMLGLFTENPVVIKGAEELRHKESDRISAMVCNLRALGADVEEYPDGLAVSPVNPDKIKKEALLSSYGDHRIAMINILLAKKWGLLLAEKELFDVSVSYPDFIQDLTYLEAR